MDTYAYRRWKRVLAALLVGALMLSLTACDSPASPTPAGGRLRVVATTTIVGDVVRQVGGEHIELTVLLAPGIDPHAFQPTPQDVAMVSQAQVVFVNGVGLEEFLDELLQHAGGSRPVISVSEGIAPRALTGDATDEHGNLDPHVWFSPANVSIWARNIARVLSTLDPAHQEAYAANAAA
ncbi:MAG: zinc ABC transporter substrate-binding protein, partial [Chloroflexi bacterium]|nr:zinc ABC transporter substrate-binding protein [Chloroflexota bacterium]